MPLSTLQEFDTQLIDVVGKSIIFIWGKPNAFNRDRAKQDPALASFGWGDAG